MYAYGLPVVITVIPLITNDYGPSGIYCWIKEHDTDKLRSFFMRLGCFYIFLIASFIYNSISYYRVYKHIKKYITDTDGESPKKKLLKKLYLYPFI